MSRTPAEAGRYASNKGKQAERFVAAYFRSRGWGEAERYGSTGWRNAVRESPDVGDIKGVHPLVVQVKYYAEEPSDAQVAQWLGEAEAQRVAAGGKVAVLVVRRKGKADPALWWAWLRADVFERLTGGEFWPAGELGLTDVVTSDLLAYPVRLRLDHCLSMLHNSGYGRP
ncbi:hypothetical protein [Saccharopolyspora mangrovi]|uniref:Holliday junction resolvase n=1 Tax=Saccharopolyspora mangrovi TaxID=3082379 RepID=A0ABU6A7D6_9PSEU|nr:hypothetical protein [Saccharopolyspora sp. S2-29]MEB3367396.1 hypothetical protein [Saccharopolyspora sp. S2-29]